MARQRCGSAPIAAHVKEAAIEPVVREGSCILWDFRLMHGGTPNRSALPRPLLYLTYCRPWFMEYMNFNAKKNPKQKPLLATKTFLSGLSEQHRRLLRGRKRAEASCLIASLKADGSISR